MRVASCPEYFETIPYVIDNQQRRLAEMLKAILAEHAGKSLDVATMHINGAPMCHAAESQPYAAAER